MSVTSPAELFGEYKYEVPPNAIVPEGVEVLRLSANGRVAGTYDAIVRRPEDRSPNRTYWTKEPIPIPTRPELPTEVGTVLHGVTVEGVEGTHAAMLAAPGVCNTCTWVIALVGEYCWAKDSDILSWTLVTAPDGTQTPGPAAKPRDVMDEDDKSPVLDYDGDRWEWDGRGWFWSSTYRATKADIDEDHGPLRFADEVKR